MNHASWKIMLLIIFFHVQHTSADLVDVVCKTTQNYKLCAESLRSDPRSLNADAKGLALIMIQLALYKTTRNIVYIERQMIELNKLDDLTSQQCLQVCYKKYNFIVNYFILNAIKDLYLNRYRDATFAIALSGRNISSCADTCVNSPFFNLANRSNEYAYFVQVVADKVVDTTAENATGSGATTVASSNRTIIIPAMAATKKPEKFSGIDFKR
ncbi:uncharacterized protein LOC132624460 [Lycium barbarum]|uniref:uncharacterized protein LOC132624460 n=1 Tax=Lycium barbarum TaxID=112863 RepID=UPI00293F21A0|nr:uncharacterized protein LOC132624460 [Lycium barbarum]